MTQQLDMFKQPHPLEGVRVKVTRGRGCRKCKIDVLVIARVGIGPHAAELECPRCHKNCNWLSKEAVEFVTTIISKFGAPDGPVVLRTSD